ncbi:uncharacterized protein TM35_000212050 [Trypanosoma theileri]|uniref:Uncharacterized protein n=1 Tax=Trypanosoma theileri TaxID=67003 RepID=A0A1X0NTU5_9TRYP|nr:uncharacterized protein TM35_000212050 [Trypanosoma theileri]ORC87599.1 hypothetical protein TM35_000212050 [Trypanosoma theileri]
MVYRRLVNAAVHNKCRIGSHAYISLYARLLTSRSAPTQISRWTFSAGISLQQRRLFSTQGNHNNPGDDDYVFDASLSVQKEAAVQTAKKTLDVIIRELLPENAPAEAVQKVRVYLQQHPMDTLITQPKVQITHVEDPDSGTETKISLSPCELAEALQQAKERSMNLVQMGTRGDIAYCRIRNETPRILGLVSEELEALRQQQEQQQQQSSSRGSGRGKDQGVRELIDHTFRDVVDAHFVGWRSQKIVQDLRRRHPVRLSIKEFQSPDTALAKMREMCDAVRRNAESAGVAHHYTSLVATDREVSITLAPNVQTPPSSPSTTPTAKSSSKSSSSSSQSSSSSSSIVRHPGEREWSQAAARMLAACRKSGRHGTYVRNAALKPRSLGQTLFRVDKYGRKIE